MKQPPRNRIATASLAAVAVLVCSIAVFLEQGAAQTSGTILPPRARALKHTNDLVPGDEQGQTPPGG